MTAGGSVALLGYSNQEVTVGGISTETQTASFDSDLAVCVNFLCDLPMQAAEGSKCRTTHRKSLSVCRHGALARVRGEASEEEEWEEDVAPCDS